MKVKPKQLRKYIDEVKVRHLCFERDLEKYELVLQNFDDAGQDVSIAEAELEQVRKNNRKVRKQLREYVGVLEKVLREDEESNGWKGDDRVINIR